MRQQSDQAYVLRTQLLAESDLIVNLLTEQHGKLRGVARAARKSRRRFGGLLEPMTHVRVAWSEKEGRELQRIDRMDGLRSFATMQAEPALQAACAVLAEVADRFAQDGEADRKGYDLLGAVLEGLADGADPFVLLRYFEFWTLRLHGLLPDLDSCDQCGRRFNNASAIVGAGGSLRCTDCDVAGSGSERRIGSRERRFMADCQRKAPADMPDDDRPARPGGPLEKLLRGRLEEFSERPFRTYRHLQAAIGADRLVRRRGLR